MEMPADTRFRSFLLHMMQSVLSSLSPCDRNPFLSGGTRKPHTQEDTNTERNAETMKFERVVTNSDVWLCPLLVMIMMVVLLVKKRG
jgi:hypothetical protein